MTPLGKSILAMAIILLVLLGILWFSLEYQRDNPLKYKMRIKPAYAFEGMDDTTNDTTNTNDTTTGPVSAAPVSNTPYILYYFYSKTCGPCIRFVKVWNTIVQHNKFNPKTISFQAIDINDSKNDDLVFYYNIKKTPTLIIAGPDGSEEISSENQTSYEYIMQQLHRAISNKSSLNLPNTNGQNTPTQVSDTNSQYN